MTTVMARGLLGPAVVLSTGVAAAATVVAVDEGDSLRLRDGEDVRTVRLACLDAPELGQQPHGARARESLRRLVPVGSTVQVVPHSNPGAPTAMVEVYSPTGNVNLELVRLGQAFSRQAQQPDCDPLRYAAAENNAQFRRLGVWGVDGGLQPPWEWRAARREQQPARRRPSPSPAVATLVVSGEGSRSMAPAGRPSSPSGGTIDMANLCLVETRRQYRLLNPGVPAPPGYFEDACACIVKLPKGETSMESHAQRCVIQAAERYIQRNL